jgi:hypothetical protein
MLNFHNQLLFFRFSLATNKKDILPLLRPKKQERLTNRKNETQYIIHAGNKKQKGVKYFYAF